MDKKVIEDFVGFYKDSYGIMNKYSQYCNDFDLVYRQYDNQYELTGYWKLIGKWVTLAVVPAQSVFSFVNQKG
jgi:hypothetical protein